jgi:hypothetical protein
MNTIIFNLWHKKIMVVPLQFGGVHLQAPNS